MRAVARVFIVFVALLLIGGALFLLAVNYNLVPGLAVYLPGWAGEEVVIGAVAALLLIALIFLVFGFRRDKGPGNAVLKGSEYGEVAISITAIENMIFRVVQQTQGIKDVSRKVSFTQDGLNITVKITVEPDVSMPAVTNELQAKVKEYVEEITGITVHEVKVMVENIVTDQAPTKKQS